MNLLLRKQIAESHLGNITWESDTKGTCNCPGADTHTNTGSTATVFIDAVPNIHCFHASCKTKVSRATTRLRAAINVAEPYRPTATTERTASCSGDAESPAPAQQAVSKAGNLNPAIQENNLAQPARENDNGIPEAELRRVRNLAKANLPDITAQYPIDPDEWGDRSPIYLPESRIDDDWRQLLRVMPREERIWIGDVKDSGQPEHARNFRLVRDWLNEEKCPGQFICPANFQEGSFQRSEANAIWTHFVIVESDKLSKADVSSLFLWLARSWRLVAVVDTGNKSLHGWYEEPVGLNKKERAYNKAILDGFGCDISMLRPSQPCRLPGWLREDKNRWQTLLYLDEMTPHA